MTTVELKPVGPGATRYFCDELKHGRGMAQLVRELPLEEGAVSAFLPADTAPDSFADGSLRSESEKDRAVQAVIDYLIVEFGLTRDPNIALITQFADGASPGPDLSKLPPARGYSIVWRLGAESEYDDGELWFVGAGAEPSGCANMMGEALWFPAVAVLTKLASETQLGPGGVIGYAQLRDLVVRADVILCGAWDAMNWLLWTPPRPTRA